MRKANYRRARAVKKQMIWTAIQTDQVAMTTTTAAADLVLATDWTTVGGFEKGAVLERIRGNYNFSIGAAAAASPILDFGIFCLNDSETVPDPGDVSSYVLEDCLWQARHELRVSFSTAAGFAYMPSYHFEVDVKARRRLNTNTTIAFAFTTSSITQTPLMTCRLRALISKP